jgi:pimeloyl-ACP methyl ester carboxylesterase
VRASGRAYLRELRAFAAMLSGDSSETRDNASDDGVTWIGGYPMSAETAEALSAINLASTPLPQAEARRVLLIGRDAHGIDEKLRRSLEESGAVLDLLEADDYHRLIAEPDFGWAPDKTILASIKWLHSSSDHQLPVIRHDRLSYTPRVLSSVKFEYGGAGVREQLHMLDTSEGRIVGITSEPAIGPHAPYGLVVVNAGALRHTAPSRMFVEIARRAAARGIPTTRFDLPGLGDSDGTWVRTFERHATDDGEPLAALKAIYDHLQELGVADRFLSMGLCLGGYFAVRASVEDERSIGAIALNIPAFKWTDAERKRSIRWFSGLSSQLPAATEPADDGSGGRLGLTTQRMMRRFHSTRWRLARQLGDVDALWRFENRGGISAAGKTLNHLGKNDAKVLLLMGNKEPGLRMLDVPRVRKKLERWPSIQLERLPTGDHNLRPPEIQDLFFELALLALDRAAGGDTAGS